MIGQRFLKLDCLNSPVYLSWVKPSLSYTSIYTKIVHQIQGRCKNSVLPAGQEEEQSGQEEAQVQRKAIRGVPRCLGTSTIYTPPASIIHLLMLTTR